jgi:NAD(P)-dependent dehydrogenase (short-subunit alcohol dehydrogenase family)
MLGTHYGIAAMRRGSGGAIVNISSRAGIGFAPYGAPEYAASKAAIWRFSAALLVRSDGLAGRVALCPHDGAWGLVPLDDLPALEPVRGLER